MAYLIPIFELSPSEIAGIRNDAVRAVSRIVAQELKKSLKDLVVRDILPATDLDYTNETWTETTGATENVYETMSTGNLGADRWIGFYGVKVEGELSVSLIRFTSGGGQRAVWNLQNLSAVDGGDLLGFTPSVVVLTPNSSYTIERYVRLSSSPANIVLKGFVVEARGRTVSP